MNQTWVVIEERGNYSDYQMCLISVHDCQEGADEERDRLNKDVDKQRDGVRSLLRQAWELSGREIPDYEDQLWEVRSHCPAEYLEAVKEKLEAAEKTIRESGVEWSYKPEYSVQGPFEVIPWVKPGKLIQD